MGSPFFVANANATKNLRCICVATIAIINATQMNRKGGGILWNGKAVYWNIRKILQTPF